MRRFLTTLFALLLTVQPSSAQERARSSALPSASASLVAGVSDSAVLAGLRFRSIGPAVMSGRISDIAVPPAERAGERLGKTVYVASAAGGVWKTTNAGVTWSPIFDAQRVSSIGAVAVAPTDPQVVWVGTGEANNLRSSSWGDGIYRSTDGGATWSHMGLHGSQHLARIVVHPRNEQIVWAAAMGPLWDSAGERGLYRTDDGGRTWQLRKGLGPFTGFTDIVLDPTNPEVIFAASFQRERTAYSFVAGGPESGIWKSTDGGETWVELTEGLPAGDRGRIGLDIARSRPATIYATVSAADGGIFRSDDAGATWTRTSTLQSIPWFFGQIRVDPLNHERVYHLGVQLSVSDDGGRTFRSIARNTHADHHAMWIDPGDPDHLIIGNDGGLYFSHDAGTSWDFAINLPVSTFYAIGTDMRDPYWVYGGLQDNGTWGAPSRTLGRSGAGNSEWVRAGGGDGFYAAIDPTDPDVVYLESQNGALRRFHFATRESKSIRPTAEPGVALRYNWMAPILISPHDHRTLYFGANVLFRSTDRGDTWERVSDDLTRNLNRDSLPIMGLNGPGGFGRHEGTAEFGNISTIDESPIQPGLLYVGTDDGIVQVTRDGGRSWTRIEVFPGVPDMTYVSRVVASAHEEGTVYVTLDGHRSNDFNPYVLRSTNYGRSFTAISDGLREAGSVYVLREHPRNRNLLLAGAEYGVFVSLNGGGTWARLENGIDPAPVHDLLIHPRDNDVVVATHGRGIYILDDIGALESLGNAAERGVTLFRPRAALLYSPRADATVFGSRNFTGANPPPGALITYFVSGSAAAIAEGVLRVTDSTGRVVRELSAPLAAGTHRLVWDLRYAPPGVPTPTPRRPRDEEEEDEAPRFQQNAPQGPFAAAGTYGAELVVDGDVAARATFELRLDPAVALTADEYTALVATRMHAYRLQLDAHRVITQLEETKQALEGAAPANEEPTAAGVRALLGEIDAALAGLRPAGRGAGTQTAGAEQPLLARVNGVAAAIGSAHFIPTPQQLSLLQDAERELPIASSTAAGFAARARALVPGR